MTMADSIRFLAEYDRTGELPECKHCLKRAPGAMA